MNVQERLHDLYHAQFVVAEKAMENAASAIEDADDLTVGWQEDQLHVLPVVQQRLRTWEADLRHIRSDVGLRYHKLVRGWLLVSWEHGSWHRPLPILILFRIGFFVLGVLALAIAHLISRIWRWFWRNRFMIAVVTVILAAIVMLTFALVWILDQLPGLIESIQNSIPR